MAAIGGAAAAAAAGVAGGGRPSWAPVAPASRARGVPVPAALRPAGSQAAERSLPTEPVAAPASLCLRRQVLAAVATAIGSGGVAAAAQAQAPAAEAQSIEPAVGASQAPADGGGGHELVEYVDADQGFALLRPARWEKVDKAGATLLFEDPLDRKRSLGVVVTPVRIDSLRQFGSLDVVAGKLIEAEKKKQSTNDASIIAMGERETGDGVPLYTLEYALDSSRGIKRTLTAVTIASRKLFILNIAYPDSSAKPASPELTTDMHRVLDSFQLNLRTQPATS
eukprot:SM000019S05064  [mRNA]  locus=s19:735552:736714:- [translate_table: standard]